MAGWYPGTQLHISFQNWMPPTVMCRPALHWSTAGRPDSHRETKYLYLLSHVLSPYCRASSYFSFLHVAAATAAKSLQSCPTLCDPIDGSPPGSAIPGLLQARTLEWVAISFSNAWKWKVKVKSLSHVWLFATPWTACKTTCLPCYPLTQCPLSKAF